MKIKTLFNGESLKDILIDLLFLVVGSVVYAFGVVYFVDPHKISPGGITGIAAVVNYLLPFLPIGLLILIFNIPIITLGFLRVGGKFIFKTLFVTLISSVIIDVFDRFLPVYEGERLIAAIFGGVLIGLGLSLVMLRGGTTGGTDVLAKVIRIKYPYFSMGRLVLILDGIIVIIASITYKDLETALYSAITLFASAQMLDAVLYGSDAGRFLFIVTNKTKEISDAIFEATDRGVTILPAKGGYKNENREVVLCALRKPEVDKAVKTVKVTDPEAFTIVTVTGGVFGEGFEKKYDM
ncbi:MAG: YitT family protein [Clostridia bacterium]|nr:YitT family protein [Clostridia bacterium]